LPNSENSGLVQLGGGLLQLGVTLEEHRHMGVHLERFDHPLRLSTRELADAPAGEVIGDLHGQPGLGGRDSFEAGHVSAPFAGDR
jgi:hypothetical protein